MKVKKGESHILWGEIVVSIFRLNSCFQALGNEIAGTAGQTTARWQVLASVYLKRETVSQIARRMGLTRQSVQRISDLLVSDGLAIYEENRDHKKAKLVTLTKKGATTFEAIARVQKIHANKWSQHFSDRDLKLTLGKLHEIEGVILEVLN